MQMIVGVEARGFMFGPSIALAIGAKFVPLRKPGKLPGNFTFSLHSLCFFVVDDENGKTVTIGKVISESYELEYGHDRLEMHVDAVKPLERVIIIDDLVATGGTLSAAISLMGIYLFCPVIFLH